ncbi:MAG: GNAT family N-acetyltransferase, partial [Candidatus Eisenbacteria bacterium]
HEGAPIGGMFVVRHGDTLHDPWASSLRRSFALCPNPLVYWEAIRYAIGRGLARFDFGRSQPGSGTYRFKTQFGAVPVPLFYQYSLGAATQVPTLADQKATFDLAVRAWQRLPLTLARALGPRVRRLFPEAL